MDILKNFGTEIASLLNADIRLTNLLTGFQIPLFSISILLVSALALYAYQAYKEKKRRQEIEENLEEVMEEDEIKETPIVIPASGKREDSFDSAEDDENKPLFPLASGETAEPLSQEEIEKEEALYNALLYGDADKPASPAAKPPESAKTAQPVAEEAIPLSVGEIEPKDEEKESEDLLKKIEREFLGVEKDIVEMESWKDKGELPDLKTAKPSPQKAAPLKEGEFDWQREPAVSPVSKPAGTAKTSSPATDLPGRGDTSDQSIEALQREMEETISKLSYQIDDPAEKFPVPAPRKIPEPPAARRPPVPASARPETPPLKPKEQIKPSQAVEPELKPVPPKKPAPARPTAQSGELINRLKTFQDGLEKRFRTLDSELTPARKTEDRPFRPDEPASPVADIEKNMTSPPARDENTMELLESFIFTAKQRKML